MRERRKLVENEARRRRRRRPPERARRAGAGGQASRCTGASTSTWRSSTASRRDTGCPGQVPESRTSIASRPTRRNSASAAPSRSGGGISAIFQIENSISMTQGRGVARRARLVRRLLRSVRHVQDGLFPRTLRRHPSDLRQRPDADELDPRDVGAVGAGLLGAAPQNGGFDDRLRESIRYDTPTISGFNAGFQFSSYDGTQRPHSSAISTGAFYTQRADPARDRLRVPRQDPRHADRAAFRSRASRSPAPTSSNRSRVGAVYERLNYDATPTTNLKRNFYGLGATADVGPGLFCTFSSAAPATAPGSADGRHRASAGSRKA